MAQTLISCVGMRDPFDQGAPFWYGAALACVVTQRPEKVVLLTTTSTTERAMLVVDSVRQFDQNINVELFETGIQDPSNFSDVDLCLRKALREIAQSQKNVMVNVSSGTPQMTMCLSVLLATLFLDGVAMKVMDPKFRAANSDASPTQNEPAATLAESVQDVKSRTSVLRSIELPVVEHITRSNAISLCERFDYTGARELLESSKRAKSELAPEI